MKGQSMNKTLNLAGTGGNILSHDNMKNIVTQFKSNSNSKKKMFSQSRENRMEMQKI
jgi:hypothetical protein